MKDIVWVPRPSYLGDKRNYPTEIGMMRAGYVYDQAGHSQPIDNRWGLINTRMDQLRGLTK